MKGFGRLTAAFVVAVAMCGEAPAADAIPKLTDGYLKAAADYLSFADACVALGAADVPEAELDRIQHRMAAAGAEAAEIEEWQSNVVARLSPKVQEVLRQESDDAVRYACVEGLKDRSAAVRHAEALD